ncbi:unnamed protein product [Onchocerca flexuosa]|uniref:Calsequestrin n=1 Tax=Onchocerca flexuosa TaxID=387005 RepID=A0A183I203_9BILA|nr:unnamed protein product [Onchocerca flexuosa]
MSEKYAGTTRVRVIPVSYDAFDAIEPLKQLVEDHGSSFQARFIESTNPSKSSGELKSLSDGIVIDKNIFKQSIGALNITSDNLIVLYLFVLCVTICAMKKKKKLMINSGKFNNKTTPSGHWTLHITVINHSH